MNGNLYWAYRSCNQEYYGNIGELTDLTWHGEPVYVGDVFEDNDTKLFVCKDQHIGYGLMAYITKSRKYKELSKISAIKRKAYNWEEVGDLEKFYNVTLVLNEENPIEVKNKPKVRTLTAPVKTEFDTNDGDVMEIYISEKDIIFDFDSLDKSDIGTLVDALKEIEEKLKTTLDA